MTIVSRNLPLRTCCTLPQPVIPWCRLEPWIALAIALTLEEDTWTSSPVLVSSLHKFHAARVDSIVLHILKARTVFLLWKWSASWSYIGAWVTSHLQAHADSSSKVLSQG